MSKKILLLLSSFIFASIATAFTFKFNLLNFQTGIKDNGTYKSFSDGTFGKTCDEYRNPTGKYKYAGDIGDGIYRLKTFNNTLMNVYCDMTNNGGGWTLIASASLPNVSFATNYNITSLANSKTINFNNYDTTVFGSSIATSKKMITIANNVDGTYTYSAAAGWFVSDIGSKTVRVNWSRYSTMAAWITTDLPYSQISSYGLASFNHGSVCDTSNSFGIYMHIGSDGVGGVHQGVQMSQGGCNDNVNWKDNFNWQVYTK